MGTMVLLGLALGLWFWVDSLRAREQALRVSGNACREMDVQLLDDTVALAGLAVRRSPEGMLRVRRLYRFEFSVDGTARRSGHVELLGRSVQGLYLDYPQGATILASAKDSKIGTH